MFDVIGHGRGRPLDDELRRAMEARLGEPFETVRLHLDARSTESVDAQAYTVGEEIVVHPERANFRSPGGRQLLAHELAHVIQQRRGPVDGAPAPGGIKVSDPGDRFERAADLVGRAAATTGVPGAGEIQPGSAAGGRAQGSGPAGGPSAAVTVQRYVQAANTAILGGAHAEFEAQRVDAAARTIHAAAVPGGAGGLPAAVRASDDGNMALEDSDLTGRQPKVFYATAGVLAASNASLALVNSDYELYVDRANAIRVTLPDATVHDLDRILPRTAGGAGVARGATQQGLTMDVPPDCIMMAQAVMKHANGQRQARTQRALPNATFPEYQLARYMAAWVKDTRSRRGAGALKFWKWFSSANGAGLAAFSKSVAATATLTAQQVINNIATSYADIQRNHAALADQVAADLGLNLHAAPNVGEAYETLRVGVGTPAQTAGVGAALTRNFWGQHIGAVVAVSGGDRVTLENYARSHEINGMRTGADYYFQMYSTTAGQTWHEFWTSQAQARGAAPVGQAPAVAGQPWQEALTMVVRSGP